MYLVWDSESEVTKEGTLLESAMRVEDASDSEPSGRKRKRSKKVKKEKKSSSSSSESKEWGCVTKQSF